MPQSYLSKLAEYKLPEPLKKLAEAKARRLDAIVQLDSYLDKVAAECTPPRRYAIRVLQSRIAAGDSLPQAIKVAYLLPDREAAALAERLAAAVKVAQEDSDTEESQREMSRFSSVVPTRSMSQFLGSVNEGKAFMGADR